MDAKFLHLVLARPLPTDAVLDGWFQNARKVRMKAKDVKLCMGDASPCLGNI